MSSHWTTWHGGADAPVPVGTRLQVRHRDGTEWVTRTGHPKGHAEDWNHLGHPGDIVAYRVLEDSNNNYRGIL